jgi:uncharacterized membrane protein
VIQVVLYIDPSSELFDDLKKNLFAQQENYPHQLHVIDITKDDVLLKEFAEKAPVIDIGVYRLLWPFDKLKIQNAFEKADHRLQDAKSKGLGALVERITQPLQMTKTDRFSYWFSKHYMVLLNGFTFLYLFLAFLAPIFMHIGWDVPGKTAYKIYRPLCHQLAFRSFFIFGEQPYYPRELAGVEGVISYGRATGFNENDLNTAREFLGNETLGYKIALCQRDVAIYGAILIFGIIFSLSGRKIKPLPWYLWLVIGLGPIGLDGFSQLLSQINFGIFNWLPLRESTPLLRTFTGACFGLGTAWFGFPYLEESVLENRREMELKRAITDQIAYERSN